jgi:hypothetical protein
VSAAPPARASAAALLAPSTGPGVRLPRLGAVAAPELRAVDPSAASEVRLPRPGGHYRARVPAAGALAPFTAPELRALACSTGPRFGCCPGGLHRALVPLPLLLTLPSPSFGSPARVASTGPRLVLCPPLRPVPLPRRWRPPPARTSAAAPWCRSRSGPARVSAATLLVSSPSPRFASCLLSRPDAAVCLPPHPSHAPRHRCAPPAQGSRPCSKPRPSFGCRALLASTAPWWSPRVRGLGCRALVASTGPRLAPCPGTSTTPLVDSTGPSFGCRAADALHGPKVRALTPNRARGSRR